MEEDEVAVGGEQDGKELRTTEVFDPVANVWTAGPPLLVERSEFAAVVVLEIQINAGHEAQVAPSEFVLAAQAEGFSVEFDNAAWDRGFQIAVDPVEYERRRAVEGGPVGEV